MRARPEHAAIHLAVGAGEDDLGLRLDRCQSLPHGQGRVQVPARPPAGKDINRIRHWDYGAANPSAGRRAEIETIKAVAAAVASRAVPP